MTYNNIEIIRTEDFIMFKKLLSLLVIVGLIATSLPVRNVSAQNGPDPDYSYLFVSIGDATYYLYSSNQANNTIEKPDGLDYDKTTNTLTMTNFSSSFSSITGTNMGDDFTINVQGKNIFKSMSFSTYDYNNSVTITGTGSLTLNKNQQFNGPAISLSAYKTNSKIVIEDGVGIDIHSPTNIGAIAVTMAKEKNAIQIKGSQMVSSMESISNDVVNYNEECSYGFDPSPSHYNTVADLDEYKDSNNKTWGVKTINGSSKTYYKIYNSYEITSGVFVVEPDETYWDDNAWQEVQKSHDELPSDFVFTGRKFSGVKKTPNWDSLYRCNIAGQTGTFVYSETTEIDGDNNYYDVCNVYKVYESDDIGNILVPVKDMYNLESLPSNVTPVSTELYNYTLATSDLVMNMDAETTTTQTTTQATEQTTKTTKPQAPTTTKPYAVVKPVPPKASIKKISAKKKALKVSWKKISGVNGYQVNYAKKKSFKGGKTITINKANAQSVTIKKLSKKKKYFVRIRTFYKVGNDMSCSAWSKAKSKKTK